MILPLKKGYHPLPPGYQELAGVEVTMRLLASTRCLAKPPTGIGHYTVETLAALRRLPGIEVREFPAPWVRPLARFRERHLAWWLSALQSPPPAGLVNKCRHSLVSRLERFFLRQHDKPAWFTPAVNDLYFEPNHELFPTTLPTVAVVHDLSVLRFPQWHPANRVDQQKQFFATLVHRQPSLTVVTVTEAIRQEVIQHLGLDPRRVVAGCNAPRESMRPGPQPGDAEHLGRLGLKPGYFLHVGTLEPRKNLAMLVRAWSALDRSTRKAHPLILVGGRGWGNEELDRDMRLAPHGIRQLGYAPEAAIPALYRGAQSLVMPTHYEGYGMPVIEMRAVGGAVITSLDPAVREVAGPDTPGIDATDQKAWTRAMERAASDPAWLKQQQDAGPQHASAHTWHRGAEAVIQAGTLALDGAAFSRGRNAA